MIARAPFGFYGGKTSHLAFILPHLPYRTIYLEPFGGSGAVLLGRKRSVNEHYNDVDSNWWAFFTAVRDHLDELARRCSLSPYSEQEYRICVEPYEGDDVVEKARRWYVNVTQSLRFNPYSGWAKRYERTGHAKRSGSEGFKARWRDITDRMNGVYIHNTNALKMIERVNEKADGELVIYCDPPYTRDALTATNPYAYNLTDAEHYELAQILHKVDGYVAISGYDSPTMNEYYNDWHRWAAPENRIGSSSTGATRREVLWTNQIYQQGMLL